MISGLVLRPATLDDAEVIARLNADGNHHIEREHGLPETEATDDVVAGYTAEWTSRLAGAVDTGLWTYVAVDPAVRVVGVVSVDVRDEFPDLTSLYVHPEMLGRGIGSVLHDAAVVEHSGRQMRLWSLAPNARANQFYESRGWRRTGRTKPLPSGGEVLVELALDPARPIGDR